ncbi:ScbR family autoregulator-binding transcription factor [Agromyces aerolatus]|uniref:ScbR family autoregulator-binding transcription factor n=1 Tax=Agromyces sp. LY-1074 TaxID=3074080 RepID=UPI002855BA41|nr:MULTISPECIES: ScbR family autoregulator-binding transcription factor [unclassified Agromyces]MDR5699381.1 ScbR family autoregulator-binding transcription factor [Agromyces sp. LY-1074]MDR5705677.1 ScbR family autoregulator-binding transcription factor [Agromyces sp. LY-1358]
MSPATHSKAARTRQRIIIAAAQAVNESTFDRTSLAEIATRAGLTTGAFYFHFRSKEAVAHAVIESQNAYSQTKAMATLQSGLPTLETTLRVSADFTYDILRDPLVRAGARLTSEVIAFDRPPMATFDGWIAFNEMLLNTGMSEGVVAPDLDVRRTAEFIVGGYTGHYIFSTLLHDLRALPERILTMWEVFIRAYVIRDQEHWLERADELFRGRPVPALLTIDEAIEVHLGSA